jgi:metal-sulfur cluster biosynthetic enzyme
LKLKNKMSKVTGEQIRASLKQCMDPEIPISIVDLGLIYGIDISEKNDVNIKMTMTTKGCPLHESDDVHEHASTAWHGTMGRGAVARYRLDGKTAGECPPRILLWLSQ